jgi:serine/threonine protein kinase
MKLDKNRELPSHPNVVQVFGVSLDGPQPVIVLEYCAGGIKSNLITNSSQFFI